MKRLKRPSAPMPNGRSYRILNWVPSVQSHYNIGRYWGIMIQQCASATRESLLLLPACLSLYRSAILLLDARHTHAVSVFGVSQISRLNISGNVFNWTCECTRTHRLQIHEKENEVIKGTNCGSLASFLCLFPMYHPPLCPLCFLSAHILLSFF